VIESPTIMIRGDPPDGRPGAGADGAGRAEAELRPLPAPVAEVALRSSLTSSSTTAIASAPLPQGSL